MERVTANAVADGTAETSAGAHACLHARRCYAMTAKTLGLLAIAYIGLIT